MATLNYYLKGAIKDKNIKILETDDKIKLNETLSKKLQIYLHVSMAGKRIPIYTKKRIEQKFWLKDKQEVNCRKIRTGCVEMNEWLSDLKNKVSKRCYELENEGKVLTKSELTDILSSKLFNIKSNQNFVDQLSIFLKGQTTPSGHNLKLSTQKKYKGLVNHLNNFCKDYRIKPEFNNVDIPFLEKFRDYLVEDIGLSDNTSAKYIKQSKTYFGYFIKKGLMNPIDFSQIKAVEKEGNIYVLNLEQVLHLQNLDIKESQLAQIRDIFCFMCWTGQRYSDIEQIKNEDLIIDNEGYKVWDLIVSKTGEQISVPITPYADDILSKYKSHIYPLPRIPNQKINDQLKTLGKLAGFDSSVKIVKHYKGIKEESYQPFYTILTTHVGRKSYITNSLMLGILERIVREVSGHKDEKSFRRYVNLAKSYKNQIVQQAFSRENIEKTITSIT